MEMISGKIKDIVKGRLQQSNKKQKILLRILQKTFCEEEVVFLDFFIEKTYPIDSCEHY